MSWAPEYLSADRYLQPLFDSKSIGQNNFTRYSNRDFDRALDRDAHRALDERDMRREYQNLETLVCGEMPLIPLDLGARAYAVDEKRVDGAIDTVTSAATGMIVPRELFVK
jgi:ABC-type oligopeptide transport system substrate-binding subunit